MLLANQQNKISTAALIQVLISCHSHSGQRYSQQCDSPSFTFFDCVHQGAPLRPSQKLKCPKVGHLQS